MVRIIIFSFTLRVAPNVDAGIEVCYDADGEHLASLRIKDGGFIQSWNKQCVSGPCAGKQVHAGDCILAVNGETKAKSIMKRCKSDILLLKFTIHRGGACMNN